MTDAEKLKMVKAMTGETDEDTLSTYLSIAGNKVCRKAYPFDPTVTAVPDQYAHIQVEVAVYLLNKREPKGRPLTARTVSPAPTKTAMCRLRC